MLVLNRRHGERIRLEVTNGPGPPIIIWIEMGLYERSQGRNRFKSKIGIDAPRDTVIISREELLPPHEQYHNTEGRQS